MYSYEFFRDILVNLLEAKAKGNRDRREVEACTASEFEPSPLFRQQQTGHPQHYLC